MSIKAMSLESIKRGLKDDNYKVVNPEYIDIDLNEIYDEEAFESTLAEVLALYTHDTKVDRVMKLMVELGKHEDNLDVLMEDTREETLDLVLRTIDYPTRQLADEIIEGMLGKGEALELEGTPTETLTVDQLLELYPNAETHGAKAIIVSAHFNINYLGIFK